MGLAATDLLRTAVWNSVFTRSSTVAERPRDSPRRQFAKILKLVFRCNCVSILDRFRDIQRRIMAFPDIWVLDHSRSSKKHHSTDHMTSCQSAIVSCISFKIIYLTLNNIITWLKVIHPASLYIAEIYRPGAVFLPLTVRVALHCL